MNLKGQCKDILAKFVLQSMWLFTSYLLGNCQPSFLLSKESNMAKIIQIVNEI